MLLGAICFIGEGHEGISHRDVLFGVDEQAGGLLAGIVFVRTDVDEDVHAVIRGDDGRVLSERSGGDGSPNWGDELPAFGSDAAAFADIILTEDVVGHIRHLADNTA